MRPEDGLLKIEIKLNVSGVKCFSLSIPGIWGLQLTSSPINGKEHANNHAFMQAKSQYIESASMFRSRINICAHADYRERQFDFAKE